MRVTTTTICGTDIHILKGEYPVERGLTIGHEPVGVIEKLGSGVRGYREGQRVIAGAITPLIAARRVDLEAMVTHRFKLDDIEAAYELFGHQRRCAQGRDHALKAQRPGAGDRGARLGAVAAHRLIANGLARNTTRSRQARRHDHKIMTRGDA